jgi:LemA protein
MYHSPWRRQPRSSPFFGVRDINTAVQSFPSNLVAGAFGFALAEFYETDDAAVAEPVKVSFG